MRTEHYEIEFSRDDGDVERMVAPGEGKEAARLRLERYREQNPRNTYRLVLVVTTRTEVE